MNKSDLIQTWNEAADLVNQMITHPSNLVDSVIKKSSNECQEVIFGDFDSLVDSVFHATEHGKTYSKSFLKIATYALVGYAYESKISIQEAGKYMVQTVIGKQRMYGHGNIARFGIPGIAIRINDKLERLKNLQKHDGPVLFEPLQDTWLDICGYSVIAVMWEKGWFMLDLDDSSV